MKPVLEVHELTKVFVTERKKEITVLDHVSLCLYPGEILGIVGESGSGKSTLAKIAARLIDATEGEVFLCGQEITRLKGRKLRRCYKDIQMVFQSPVNSFDPRRTLGDGIGESLRNSGVCRSEVKIKVEKLLCQCGLSLDIAGRYPHEVSGGQCQRAAIARALAIEPKIIIFDESTSALDVTVQQQIMELLKDLKKQKNLSYLFISHDLALVQSFCDRIAVMHHGKIVEEGPADEVIFSPRSSCARELIDAAF